MAGEWEYRGVGGNATRTAGDAVREDVYDRGVRGLFTVANPGAHPALLAAHFPPTIPASSPHTALLNQTSIG